MKTALCPHFQHCGGCSKQDVSYKDQLQIKEEFVREQLKELNVQTFEPILPSPEMFFYRNKMEFSFGDSRDVAILSVPPIPSGLSKSLKRKKKQEQKELQKKAKDIPPEKIEAHLGLHPKGRFNLVTPTPDCQLLSEESQKILLVVSKWATKNRLPVYTRHNNEGVLRHLVVREGKNTNERMVNLFSTSAVKNLDGLTADLKNENLSISTFLWTCHDGLSDVAKGPPTKVYWGEGVIHEKMKGVLIRVPPTSFMQTNTHAAEQMLDVLKSWVHRDVKSRDLVLFDLYCGSGVIGLSLASQFKEVIGIELDDQAIYEAKENASLNKCQNVTFLQGRVENMLEELDKKDLKNTFLVVDPPRPGLHSDVVEALVRSQIPHIYYVSCNPVSLSRDLQGLTSKYRIDTVQPMDFFPHTDHVETAVKLSLKNG